MILTGFMVRFKLITTAKRLWWCCMHVKHQMNIRRSVLHRWATLQGLS